MRWWASLFGLLLSFKLFFLGFLLAVKIEYSTKGFLVLIAALVVMATAIKTFGKSFEA